MQDYSSTLTLSQCELQYARWGYSSGHPIVGMLPKRESQNLTDISMDWTFLDALVGVLTCIPCLQRTGYV